MDIEDQLRDKLRKVEALLAGAATNGERDAAAAAVERLKEQLKKTRDADPLVELQFTMPDLWSVRLFVALCRRYGFRPYRYRRQRRTTVMVRAAKQAFDQVVWRQFTDLHADLQAYLERTTMELIRNAVEADDSDVDEVVETHALR